MNEVLMVVFTGIGTVAAVGSAVVAIVQASGARQSKRDAADARDEARLARDESARLAAEANDAFKRQAEAQEEANRLKREELEPADWSFAQISGNKCQGVNTSKRVLFVESFDVQPDRAASLVDIESNHDDGRYEYGDSFDFYVKRVWSLAAEKLTIRYRREDDPDDDWRTLHVTLG